MFVERLWRSLKYEEVYLRAYDSVGDAKSGIGGWIPFYNKVRRHQGLGIRRSRFTMVWIADCRRRPLEVAERRKSFLVQAL